ncbi:MAG: HAMP domain-containing histidine kinase [Melioribacter sp.]|nr:HAMP domain-containing histidine kinase [Melioribacter sp.]
MEVVLGIVIYYHLYTNSLKKLDSSLSAQANAIMRILKSKHVDIETFQPDSIYASEEELVWDIIYDIVVFNNRNTFIQILSGNKVIFQSANLQKNNLDFPKIKSTFKTFDIKNPNISNNEIRVVQLQDSNYKVIVAYPKEHIIQTINSLTDIYVIIAPLFFVISIIGGALISQRSLSRIDKIIKKTEEITAHNLNEIIPGEEHHDEFGRLVKKMNEMIQRIRTSVEYMNQFSISAAHELKTPLTILRGEIEIALKSEKSPKEYIEILKSNYEETLRLIKIVDNLFFISKSEFNLIQLNKKEIEVKNFLTGIVKNASLLTNEKKHEIILNVQENFIASFDSDLIKQAITNILDNAIKYGLEGFPIVISSYKDEGNKFVIKVKNWCEEISEKDLEKIFNRFYRLDSSRSRNSGGVGLGLSVVKSIINLHAGEIRIDKSKNTIEFIIELPTT